ncbi:MAG TPA: thiamine pyrophosphate-binding protein [Myxococcaceae bacterium]|nr:thiamine pyrophosphate-binding protein [Myxococcaceae bacterium]
MVVKTLTELGVSTYYGIPGGAIASVYDALLDCPESRVINTRHETGAVFAAMGHSRIGGSLPCVLTTSGPGVTNALTGLAAAQADGVPLIVIAGEVPRKHFGRGALQEGSRYHLDVLGMVRSVTKFAAEITNPRATATLVRKAVATALSGRQGPVFLSLPLDVANEKVPLTRTSSNASTHFELDEEMLDAATEALQATERGVIVAGSGARHPEAVRWIGLLASTLQMPVITTPKAKGVFPESDPLSLGVFGLGGHPSAVEYLERGVDTVLCVGSGLSEISTNSWSPMLQASRAFIQVDIDGAQIGKNYQVDYGLVGPAHLVLEGIGKRLRRGLTPAASVSGIRYYPSEVQLADSTPLKHGRAVQLLQQVMPSDTVFTCDIGEHTVFAIHYLKVDRADGFVLNSGLGSMGSGLCAAVGVKVARPHRPVVTMCGDYGFQMYGMELATCVHHQIPVVFAVFNDARMGMVESGLLKIFGRSGVMHSHRVDFAALARSVGAVGYTIRSAEDFHQLHDNLARTEVPVVLDIHIDPASSFPVNGRVAHIRNFSAE